MTLESAIIACTTCANSFKESGGNAAGWSIAFLLVVIVAILAGIGYVMIRMAKREQLALDPQYRDEYGT